jgi:uncharacterized protein (TIGR02145 family)
MKKLKLFMILACLFESLLIYSQVGINADGSAPDRSAILDVKSTAKGLLFPRLTSTQIKNIWKPAPGLVVFNTDSADFYGYTGISWQAFFDSNDSLMRMCEDSILYSGMWYTTVQVGGQCWMAENLNAGTQVSGLTAQSNNSLIEKHCYNDIADSCAIYGGLYQWFEMMNYSTSSGAQGICPAGWHIPTADQWDVLINYLGGTDAAGGAVKATGLRYWKTPNTGSTNSSGFSAYGSGTYDPIYGNHFYAINDIGIYWTSNWNGNWSWRRDLYYNDAGMYPYLCQPDHSFSVRCLKD